MDKLFLVKENRNRLKIRCISRSLFESYMLYIDGQHVATFYHGTTFYWSKLGLIPGQHTLTIAAYQATRGTPPHPVMEEYDFSVEAPTPQRSRSVTGMQRERDFKAGDILVASDNVNEAYTGYMGHSAIVISEKELIESPGHGRPAIRKDSIQQFLDIHPAHVHYRPTSAQMGQQAADYAKQYLAKYKQNLEKGEKKPEFSFSLDSDLKDPWVHVYCSKLVWLSYFNGANYKFDNDYLWFSPEDLYTNLKNNDKFKEIYKSSDFEFKINT